MISLNLIPIVDFMTILWLLCLFAFLFVAVPYLTHLRSNRLEWEERLTGSLAKASVIICGGVLVLVSVKLLNWFTLALWYSLWCFVGWIWGNWLYRLTELQTWMQQGILGFIDVLDHGIPLDRWVRQCRKSLRGWKTQDPMLGTQSPQEQTSSAVALHWIFGAAIVSFSMLLRWEHPVQALRFAYSGSYQTLLATRQLLSGDWGSAGSLPTFPAFAAALSLLGSINAMQVVRFLPPLMGTLMTLAVGYSLWRSTQNRVTPLIGMYALGAYLFTWTEKLPSDLPGPWQAWSAAIVEAGNQFLIRQATGNNLDLAVLFLLIACGQLAALKSKPLNFALGVNLASCSVLILMTAPSILGLLVLYAVGRPLGRYAAIWGLSLGWAVLGAIAALPNTSVSSDFLQTLPIPLSLVLALGVECGITIGKWFFGKSAQSILLTVLVIVSIKFCLPGPTTSYRYLEYEMAARKALEISVRFPAKQWLMVAPIEQLSEIYGVGWYEDLAGFVKKYGNQAGNREFRFPIKMSDLFIFVEKRPFITFPTLPAVLPDALAFDPIYQSYRSTAGRATLQYYALQLCEDYRRSHSDLTIDFEDADFRIYHLSQTVKSSEQ